MRGRETIADPRTMEGTTMKGFRKHRRSDWTLRVAYHDETEGISRVKVVRANISLGGICMYFSDPVEIGKRVLMAISTSFWAKPIKVRGKVVWRELSELHRSYLVGVKFIDASWTRLKVFF